ncbi:MAG: ATP-binding cassette domain-containing protein, partial [Verrucomicrobiota bacterium]|nr:ATP-binding cassette domain-containing protein [Verrucomicrobiota bacterium]
MSSASSGPPPDPASAARALLELDDVTILFGGLKAVTELDLRIEAGEMVGLIGPNGAGKTTIFNLI